MCLGELFCWAPGPVARVVPAIFPQPKEPPFPPPDYTEGREDKAELEPPKKRSKRLPPGPRVKAPPAMCPGRCEPERFSDLQRSQLSSWILDEDSLRGLTWRAKTCSTATPFGICISGLLSQGNWTWVHKYLQALDRLYSDQDPEQIDSSSRW